MEWAYYALKPSIKFVAFTGEFPVPQPESYGGYGNSFLELVANKVQGWDFGNEALAPDLAGESRQLQ